MSSTGPIFLPKGFKFSAVTAGIKASGKSDLALILAEPGSTAAAMFTRNLVVAAPVQVGRVAIAATRGRVRGVIVNSGNANCATGPAGIRACRSVSAQTAKLLNTTPSHVFSSSTGIIGVPLPIEKITSRLEPLVRNAESSVDSLRAFADAILTTDTRPKISSVPLSSGKAPVHRRCSTPITPSGTCCLGRGPSRSGSTGPTSPVAGTV